MEKARYLLATSILTVREITRTVGLPDESHFTRDSKRLTAQLQLVIGPGPVDLAGI
ncbi:MAG TPA: hypothetical protein VLB68_05200 [Pyrinomonadaceae bacterium]|nr:hypothetical protein [Pyrinomonadaceae bacterium]